MVKKILKKVYHMVLRIAVLLIIFFFAVLSFSIVWFLAFEKEYKYKGENKKEGDTEKTKDLQEPMRRQEKVRN